jgi:hypothetical protein
MAVRMLQLYENTTLPARLFDSEALACRPDPAKLAFDNFLTEYRQN